MKNFKLAAVYMGFILISGIAFGSLDFNPVMPSANDPANTPAWMGNLHPSKSLEDCPYWKAAHTKLNDELPANQRREPIIHASGGVSGTAI